MREETLGLVKELPVVVWISGDSGPREQKNEGQRVERIYGWLS